MKILTMLFTLILTLLLMHADLNQDGLQDDHVQPSLEKIQTFPRIAFSRRLVFLFPWTRISSMQEDNVHHNSDPICNLNCDCLEENNFDLHYGPESSYLNLIRNCLQDANINLNFHPALFYFIWNFKLNQESLHDHIFHPNFQPAPESGRSSRP